MSTDNGVGAHLLIEREGRILLGKRSWASQFAPGTWHLPSGKVEFESGTAAAVREAAEELGLQLDPKDLEPACLVHLLDPAGPRPLIQVFYRVPDCVQEPVNAEPDKCEELRWWDRDALPSPLVDYTAAALECIRRGQWYLEMGWAA